MHIYLVHCGVTQCPPTTCYSIYMPAIGEKSGKSNMLSFISVLLCRFEIIPYGMDLPVPTCKRSRFKKTN